MGAREERIATAVEKTGEAITKTGHGIAKASRATEQASRRAGERTGAALAKTLQKRLDKMETRERVFLPHPMTWEEAVEFVAGFYDDLDREQLQDMVDEAAFDVRDAEERWAEVTTWEDPLTTDQCMQMAAAFHEKEAAIATHRYLQNVLMHFDQAVEDLLRDGVVHIERITPSVHDQLMMIGP